jgi:hypothetical protein
MCHSASMHRVGIVLGIVQQRSGAPARDGRQHSGDLKPVDSVRRWSRSSCRSVCRNQPSQDEEVAATQRAAEWQKQPVEGCLKGVPVAYAPEIDRSAMWATCEQHTLTVPPLASRHRVFRSGGQHVEGRFALCLPLIEKLVNLPEHFISDFRRRSGPGVSRTARSRASSNWSPEGLSASTTPSE